MKSEEIKGPFEVKDFELKKWENTIPERMEFVVEYTIPEGMEAIIKDGKVIVRVKESEDERMRKAALKGIEYLEHNLSWDAIGDIDILDVKEYLEKQREHPTNEEMLRTLRAEYEKGVADTIAKYEQEEQEPVEWSEEDKNKFDLLHTCICHCINDPYWEYSKREKVSKEIIPFIEKFKFLRPFWKPSEEQMDALRESVSFWRGATDKAPRVNILESLYTDLKKL